MRREPARAVGEEWEEVFGAVDEAEPRFSQGDVRDELDAHERNAGT